VTAPFETQVLAQPEAISGLTDQIIDHLDGNGVDARTTHHVALAIEELLANLGTHGQCADVPATVRLFVEPAAVTVEIIDAGPSFDPRQTPDPKLSDTPSQREVGGLGLFLIRQLVSTIDYTRKGDANCTTFAVARSSAKVG